MRRLIVGLGTLLAAAVPALAEQPATTTMVPGPLLAQAPMPPAAGFNWTGLYLGLNADGAIGVDHTSQNAAFSSAALGTNGLLQTSNQLTPIGGGVGGQIGYNWQMSPLAVFGLEADGQWLSQVDTASNSTPAATTAFFGAGANGFGYAVRSKQSLNAIGTVRARAGFDVHYMLWYATGGFAWADLSETDTFVGSANPAIFPGALQPGPFLPAAKSFSSTRLGWTIGGGAEANLGGGWSAKLEYLYVDLGSTSHGVGIPINAAFGAAFTTGAAAVRTSTHISDNIIRVGLNYHFGGP